MVTWNTNIPYEDTTGYVGGSCFDSEIGYLSCYTVRSSKPQKLCKCAISASAQSHQNDDKHKDRWMVDSGCSDHLTPFPTDFVSRENHQWNCKTANGNIMPIFGPGTVILRHCNGEHNRTLVITGVYYAPHVSHCLLSVMALTKQGFTCMIRDKTQIWDKTGTLMIMAEQLVPSETLHWFLSTAMTPGSRATSLQLNQDYVLWHYRMGHCSCNALHHAPDHVSGIPKLEIPSMPPPCHGCALGKAHERPFPPSDSRGDRLLSLVHTDLCEFPVRSWMHNTWMMTFLDDIWGYGSITCLKKKLDADTTFRSWFAWAEKSSGNKLLKLCSDRVLRFVLCVIGYYSFPFHLRLIDFLVCFTNASFIVYFSLIQETLVSSCCNIPRRFLLLPEGIGSIFVISLS